MKEEKKKIVDAIKINIEIAKVNAKPLLAEVSMNENSKKYIANLILEYGIKEYKKGVLDGIDVQGKSEQLPNMTLEQAIARAKPNLDKIKDVDKHIEDIR